MGWPETWLTELFGVELPIMAAPMANFAGVELAIGVAEAGGLGALPCAALKPDQIHEGVAAFRSRSAKPLNLNFFCHAQSVEDGATDAAWLSRISPYYVELGAEVPALPLADGDPPFGEAACAAIEATRPEIVSFHFGVPVPALFARVRATGCKIVS